MSYPLKVKLEIQDRIKKGEKIKKINIETGISIATLYNWKKQLNLELNNENNSNNDIDNENQDEKEASKQIKKLIKLRKLEEAYKLTTKYPNNCVIQSQKIKILIIRKCYAKAKEIGSRFENDAHIQSQMVTIAIEEGNYAKAKEIGSRFEDNAPIQSQMITIAIKEGNYAKAKEIGSRFENYAPIQSQMITIEIGSRFENNVKIQSQMVTIETEEANNDKSKELENRFINAVKTTLYYNKEEGELIEKIKSFQGISEYKRTIILLATCEKLKKQEVAKKIFKEAKEKIQLEKEQIKTLNKIMERIKNKKASIFDFGFYDEILNWNFDLELLEQYEKELEEKMQEKSEQQKKMESQEKLQMESRNHEIRPKREAKIKNKIENQPRKTQRNQQSTIESTIDRSSNNSKNLVKEFKASIAYRQNEILVDTKRKSQRNYIEETNCIIKALKEDLAKTYVKMQSKDSLIQKAAIERSDKIVTMIDHIRDSISIMNDNANLEINAKKKQDSEAYICRICDKFRDLQSIEENTR